MVKCAGLISCSGKSTLISTIFRLIELSQGSIQVGGIDISSVPHGQLRSSIIALPQDPCLMQQSTIRKNVDPFENSSDEHIIMALKRTGV